MSNKKEKVSSVINGTLKGKATKIANEQKRSLSSWIEIVIENAVEQYNKNKNE